MELSLLGLLLLTLPVGGVSDTLTSNNSTTKPNTPTFFFEAFFPFIHLHDLEPEHLDNIIPLEKKK